MKRLPVRIAGKLQRSSSLAVDERRMWFMIASGNMHKAERTFGAWCMLLALAVCSSAAWAQAGYVHEISGFISIQKDAGKTEEVKVGDMFDANTAFRTGTDGKMTLKFADGQVAAVGADSAVRVGQYRYDPGNPGQSSSTVELTQGEMRFVAGLIGAASSTGVRVIAGNSVISMVPGRADFTVGVKPGTQETGYIVVAFGEISARTPNGQISKIAAGQYAPWQHGRGVPRPLPFTAAPATIQAAVAALWATVLPASTPAAVASSARTAAAVAAPRQAPADAIAGPRLAGYVTAISNSGSLRTVTGGRATPGVGTTFQAGAVFSTGADGNMALKFADGQVVVLGPNSNLAVAQYEFDPGNVKASKSAIDLVNGAMRVVTGYIHTENHDGISISAGASIVDIVNTGPADFTVVVNTKDQEVGVARVTLGELSVHTPYGPIDKIKIDQSQLWGPRRTPTSPIPAATALGVVEAAVMLQLSGVPDSAPVAVAPAARAAAATATANQAQALANTNPDNARLRAAAQGATELANLATQAAAAASESITAKVVATALENLAPTAAGPALAQVAAAPTALPASPIPAAPAVTPGAGGGCIVGTCRGSPQ